MDLVGDVVGVPDGVEADRAVGGDFVADVREVGVGTRGLAQVEAVVCREVGHAGPDLAARGVGAGVLDERRRGPRGRKAARRQALRHRADGVGRPADQGVAAACDVGVGGQVGHGLGQVVGGGPLRPVVLGLPAGGGIVGAAQVQDQHVGLGLVVEVELERRRAVDEAGGLGVVGEVGAVLVPEVVVARNVVVVVPVGTLRVGHVRVAALDVGQLVRDALVQGPIGDAVVGDLLVAGVDGDLAAVARDLVAVDLISGRAVGAPDGVEGDRSIGGRLVGGHEAGEVGATRRRAARNIVDGVRHDLRGRARGGVDRGAVPGRVCGPAHQRVAAAGDLAAVGQRGLAVRGPPGGLVVLVRPGAEAVLEDDAVVVGAPDRIEGDLGRGHRVGGGTTQVLAAVVVPSLRVPGAAGRDVVARLDLEGLPDVLRVVGDGVLALRVARPAHERVARARDDGAVRQSEDRLGLVLGRGGRGTRGGRPGIVLGKGARARIQCELDLGGQVVDGVAGLAVAVHNLDGHIGGGLEVVCVLLALRVLEGVRVLVAHEVVQAIAVVALTRGRVVVHEVIGLVGRTRALVDHGRLRVAHAVDADVVHVVGRVGVGLPDRVEGHVLRGHLELLTRGHEADAARRPVARHVAHDVRSLGAVILALRRGGIGGDSPTLERVARAGDLRVIGQDDLPLGTVGLRVRACLVGVPGAVLGPGARACIEREGFGVGQEV